MKYIKAKTPDGQTTIFNKGEIKTEKETYTVYAPHDDITFILQDTFRTNDTTTLDGNLVSTAVVGWYHGEPNEEDTQYYTGKLTATYE